LAASEPSTAAPETRQEGAGRIQCRRKEKHRVPETAKETLCARAESHSDVADTPAARAHQVGLVERQFGDTLVRRLRAARGELRLRDFTEEWLPTDDGQVYEIRAELQVAEE